MGTYYTSHRPLGSCQFRGLVYVGLCAFIAVIGIRRPLRMLPIVLFEIVYKTAWLIVIAYPLYQRNELTGTPAEGMADNFMLVILPIVAMPWRYFFRTYIVDKRAA